MQDTIAVIFDFDETLAPDSTSTFLDSLGIDVKSFWRDTVDPLIDDGWDPVPAYLYRMIEESSSDPARAITQQKLMEWGKQVQFYNGATRVFDLLRRQVEGAKANVSVEFYLISSGIGEVLRHTRIARHFNHIWACDFLYGDDGRIVFPKNVVSLTDKTRYIYQVSKGIYGPEYKGKPFEVNRKVPNELQRIPIDQMIFVGDGYTDVPCFSLVRKYGGVAIGVYDPADRKRWGRAWGFIEDDRVSNLVPANYGKNSALTHSLSMAIESMTNRILLRRNSYQG